MAVQQPEANWSDKYRENEGDSPAEAARKRKLWRKNAALNQAWQDEQLSVQDITTEEQLAEALNRMGTFNAKEEGQSGFRRVMSRGLGYQRNLQDQAKDYYGNLWNREGLEQIRPGIWKDVRPNGSIVYRDSQGWVVDANGKRTGQNYIGSLYNAGTTASGGPTYSLPGYNPAPKPPDPTPGQTPLPDPTRPLPPKLPPGGLENPPEREAPTFGAPSLPGGYTPKSFGSTGIGTPGIPQPNIPSTLYPSPGLPGTRTRNGVNSVPNATLPGMPPPIYGRNTRQRLPRSY